MEPFEVIVFEFLLGYCLQGFAIVLGVYAFNQKKVVIPRYILASVLVIVVSYLVRILPISFGVHTIINMLFMFLIGIVVLKMPSYITIRSALLVTVLLLVCEMIDVAVMMSILGQPRFENMMLVSSQKALVGLPGTLFFSLLTVIAYYISNYKLEKKGEIYGDISA